MAFDWSKSPNSAASSAGASAATSSAVGAGAGLAETYIQYGLNSRESQRAYERQQELMRQEYDYNQKAQRRAAVNARAGLEDAGLSPAVLSQGGFSAAGASAGGVSPASVSAPRLRPDPVTAQNATLAEQVALMGEQIKDVQASAALKDAQKENVEAQTSGVNIDNARKADADFAAGENMRQHFISLKSSLDKLGLDTTWIDDRIDEIDSGDRKYTAGSIELNKLFEDYRKELLENVPRYDKSVFDAKVSKLMADNDNIAEAVATLPETEQNKLKAEISKLYMDGLNAQMSGALNAKKIDEIDANIKALVQRMKSEYLRDPRLMLKDEDYASFASYLGMDVYERGMDMISTLLSLKAGQVGNEALETLKQAGQESLEGQRQAGQESLERMRQEGQNYRSELRNAPKTEHSVGHKNEDGSFTIHKTSSYDNPYKPDYTQPKKPSRKRGKRK